MIRKRLFVVIGIPSAALAAAILYALISIGSSLFFSADRTFGRARDFSFRAGNLYVEYETFRSRWRASERLEFVFLTEEPTAARTNGFGFGGRTHTHTLVYRDGGMVRFTTKPGGTTVWIGKDRTARIAPTAFRTSDIQFIEKLRDTPAMQVSPLEEFQAVIARLKAEPGATPKAAPPHR